MAFAKELLKRGMLFERLANCAMEHPNEIIQIFNGLVLSTAQFCEFLDELLVFSDEISIEFCSLLRKVLSPFPTSVYKPPARERRVISVTWINSERNGDAEPEGSTFDLWTFLKGSRRCQSSPRKEGFSCYTCGITQYRLICIVGHELCHHGHDVVLATFDSAPAIAFHQLPRVPRPSPVNSHRGGSYSQRPAEPVPHLILKPVLIKLFSSLHASRLVSARLAAPRFPLSG
jgi:hypothetical protein